MGASVEFTLDEALEPEFDDVEPRFLNVAGVVSARSLSRALHAGHRIDHHLPAIGRYSLCHCLVPPRIVMRMNSCWALLFPLSRI